MGIVIVGIGTVELFDSYALGELWGLIVVGCWALFGLDPLGIAQTRKSRNCRYNDNHVISDNCLENALFPMYRPL